MIIPLAATRFALHVKAGLDNIFRPIVKVTDPIK